MVKAYIPPRSRQVLPQAILFGKQGNTIGYIQSQTNFGLPLWIQILENWNW
jgi:hypothetical protein